ncbi:hypothetical protein LTR36_000132 [Oleoguttula mirabilis]|uniref:F-box domain-containing protein n=1 Tax=Oleoguttula mirabilis TaxID=1507867 RepID=A0AAV9JYB2_9PEZI|nr:hypothetical protein LTR36_000132 [Oleoguttula mirabilis]
MARSIRTLRKCSSTFIRDVASYNNSGRSYINIDSTPSSVQQLMVSAFENLGVDVLKCIFDFLRLPSDLRACCLVNRNLRTHTLARLYNHIDLHLDFRIAYSGFGHQVGLIDARNPGLKLVRELTIRPNEYAGFAFVWVWLQAFIRAVPAGQLRSFRWLSNTRFDHGTTELLWRKHPRLQNLQTLARCSSPYGNKTQTNLASLASDSDAVGFTEVRSLKLAPASQGATAAGYAFLQRLQVQDLAVNGIYVEDDGIFRNADTGASNGSFAGTLFGGMPPQSLPRLTSLRLKNIDLKEIWLERLDLTQLRVLALEYCANIDAFLHGLTVLDDTPIRLESLTVVHKANMQDQVIERLDVLLHKTPGTIRHLELCLRDVSRGPDPTAINAHHGSLRHLVLDVISTAGPVRWTDRELSMMLKGCENLSQLALYTKVPDFESIFDDCFDSGDTIYSGQSHGEFVQTWKTVFEHVNLTTLNLLTWPRQYWETRAISQLVALQPSLQQLAWQLLQRGRYTYHRPGHRTRRLEILAFGIRERNTSAPCPRYFVESDVTVMQRTRKTAVHVGLKQLHEEGLGVDILHYEWRDWDKLSRLREEKAFYVCDELTVPDESD